MKSTILIIFATILTTAILAPSVIMLTNIDDKAIVIDFNEEEKKEEKKEAKESDYFLDLNLNALAQLCGVQVSNSHFYIERDYDYSSDVFLPPPEHNS